MNAKVHMSGRVRLDAQGRIARVVLAHPGKLNAMSSAMWRQLRSVFDSIQAGDEHRCVLVCGEGGSFCTGGDISASRPCAPCRPARERRVPTAMPTARSTAKASPRSWKREK
jgi:enoyl-CoA hydratase/carnithine racemase